jgi:uncharacterized protein (TIGR00645 family)
MRAMPSDIASSRRRNPVERLMEQAIFGSRWLLAPFYLGLAASLLVLLAKFVMKAVGLFAHALSADPSAITLGILSLIDMTLLGNLLLMVVLAGYESFVSRLDLGAGSGRLDWMGTIGFSDLKLKLMASIVAITAVYLLEAFVNADHMSDRELAWHLGILLAFVVSGVLLALMDRLSGHH